MTLDCICIPVRDMEICIPMHNHPEKNKMLESASTPSSTPNKERKEIDLCKIQERSQQDGHGQQKHDDFGCHYQGEKRQNLINKLKMYLDDYDDRPVMKRKGGGAGKGQGEGEGQGQGQGQTGYGPMIRYPGYVDYNHPYFSSPYNRMPTLATTVNQRPGGNPCSPYPVRAEDPEQARSGAEVVTKEHTRAATGGGQDGHLCECARRRGQEPRCPAAQQPQQPQQPKHHHQQQQPKHQQQQHGHGAQPRVYAANNLYCCVPLPD